MFYAPVPLHKKTIAMAAARIDKNDGPAAGLGCQPPLVLAFLPLWSFLQTRFHAGLWVLCNKPNTAADETQRFWSTVWAENNFR